MPVDYQSADQEKRAIAPSLGRGARGRCPNCGTGRIFGRFLKVNGSCTHCGQSFDGHRADDAPPYFTMLITGHVIVPLMVVVERAYAPDIWIHLTAWPIAMVVMILILLQPIKGALIGLQWANRMHGFGDADDDPAEQPVRHAAHEPQA